MSFEPIRVSRHEITEEDRNAVLRVLSDNRPVARGREVRSFEEEFADYVGAKHAIACSSGTAALHLAVMAYKEWQDGVGWNGRPPLDIPTITFAATANAAHLCGYDVQYYDNMDPGRRGNKAMVIHYGGEADVLRDCMIEDAAHALGARYSIKDKNRFGVYDNKKIGSCPESAMTCFSFHPTKHITTGEGGMITTNEESLNKTLRSLIDNGRTFPHCDEPWRYSWDRVGTNYEMSEMAAALGRKQLARIDDNVSKRRRLAGIYYHKLKKATPHIPCESSPHCSYHLFPVQIDFEAVGKSRQQVMFELMRRGIETQVHYYPLHLQPMGGGKRGDHPHAEAFYDRELSLPMHHGLSEEDVRHVCDSLNEVLG